MGLVMSDIFRIFPRATAQERTELRSSIQAVGLRNPIVIDEFGSVIDGYERRDICIELGIDWLAGADVRIGLIDVQKKALAIELNLWRRPIHLTRKQRNELLDIYLIANPHLSESQVGELFGVNQSTVNRRKRELMRLHKLPPVTATVGKDGITRQVGERRKNPARLIVKSRAEY
jgi:ParB-like chromosome segregation protein Spo0J